MMNRIYCRWGGSFIWEKKNILATSVWRINSINSLWRVENRQVEHPSHLHRPVVRVDFVASDRAVGMFPTKNHCRHPDHNEIVHYCRTMFFQSIYYLPVDVFRTVASIIQSTALSFCWNGMDTGLNVIDNSLQFSFFIVIIILDVIALCVGLGVPTGSEWVTRCFQTRARTSVEKRFGSRRYFSFGGHLVKKNGPHA